MREKRLKKVEYGPFVIKVSIPKNGKTIELYEGWNRANSELVLVHGKSSAICVYSTRGTAERALADVKCIAEDNKGKAEIAFASGFSRGRMIVCQENAAIRYYTSYCLNPNFP